MKIYKETGPKTKHLLTQKNAFFSFNSPLQLLMFIKGLFQAEFPVFPVFFFADIILERIHTATPLDEERKHFLSFDT